MPYTCHMPRPSHFSLFDQRNNIWRSVKILKLHIMNSRQSPVTLSLDPNIFITLFSNTTIYVPPLMRKTKASYLYKATRKVTVLYVLIFIILGAGWKTKDSWLNGGWNYLI
jgi:hypothetical protein